MRAVEVRAAAGADHGGLDASGLEQGHGLAQPGRGHLGPATGRIGHQPFEPHALEGGNQPGQLHRLLGRLHAAALAAGIALDQHRQHQPRLAHRRVELACHHRIVEGDGQP